MIWMKPLSHLYQAATDVKNGLFAKNILKAYQAPVPVISIGNLTVGGTGKTPFVDYTVKYFSQKNLKIGVVSRAYKASAKAPVKVDIHQKRASEIFGDEPVWLAEKNPGASVFAGQTKWQIAQWAVSQEKLDLLILDDGFQHRHLKRDLDIVILDATEKWENYQVLPAGRAREKFAGLERADLVVISKCNWAAAEDLQFLKSQIPPNKKTVETTLQVRLFHELHSGKIEKKENLSQSSCLLFCSIARPDVFENMMATIFKEVDILAFPDHHLFTPEDVESILHKMKARGLGHICCTEKDAVKLRGLWPVHQMLWVSELDLEIINGEDKLHAAYDQFCS